ATTHSRTNPLLLRTGRDGHVSPPARGVGPPQSKTLDVGVGMRAILRVASLIGALLPTLAVSQQTDLLCVTVMTKKQRTALLEGKDARQLEREGYPSDPYAVYLKAKEI